MVGRELGDKTIQAQRDRLGFKQLTFAKTNLWLVPWDLYQFLQEQSSR